MVRAYIEIKVESGREREVRDKLRTIPGVKLADIITGDIDIIVVVEAETYNDIAGIILEKIRKIPGIVRTETHIAFE